jgi:hypothetical protein
MTISRTIGLKKADGSEALQTGCFTATLHVNHFIIAAYAYISCEGTRLFI